MDSPIGGHDQSHPLVFTGTGAGYFRVWIVNLTLSIITLGIFSAWAKVRRLKYMHGHTQLQGHGFDYVADPVKILKGRILAFLVLMLYSLITRFEPDYALYALAAIALASPFIMVTSFAFTMRNTTYRNLHFGFRKDIVGAYKAALLPIALGLLAAAGIYGLIPDLVGSNPAAVKVPKAQFLVSVVVLCFLPFLPWLDYIRCRFLIMHGRYGNRQMSFTATISDFYGLYGKLLGLSLLGFLLFSIVVGIAVVGTRGPAASAPAATPPPSVVWLTILAIVVPMFCIGGWFAARRNNLLRNHIWIGNNGMSANFGARQLMWLYFSNMVGLLLTLGFFFPWAAIRLARYNATHTRVKVADLETAVATDTEEQSALGEELGQFFDIDVGL